MRTILRVLGIIGALLLAAALGGCSAIKLGYSTAPELGYWWLDGHLAFDDTQRDSVRESIRQLHTWHRTQELPRIAELLGRAERAVAGDMTAAQACAFLPPAQERLTAALEQALPAAAQVVQTLTPRQIRHLQRKYESSNADWNRDWLQAAPAEVAERRYKQWLDRAEMVYGPLDDAQRELLRSGLERLAGFDASRMLAQRQRRQQDLLELLRRHAGTGQPPEATRAALAQSVGRLFQSPDPAYRAQQQAWLEAQCRVFAQLHASTRPAQRERAVNRLRGWQRDLRELAAP